MKHTARDGRSRSRLALAVSLALAGQVQAAQIDIGDSDLTVRWDNTLRYNAAFRTSKPLDVLTANINSDDGDRNFKRGLISNRIELTSELDVTSKQGYGLRVSGIGWYDSVYNGKNDNPGLAGGAMPNHTPGNEFPSATRRAEGRKAELRDAFVFGRMRTGDTTVSVRAGQLAQLWGESLFFAGNGIAGAQSSFDVGRLLADPTAQAKEFVLPVPQVSADVQFSSDLSMSAYYQLRWKPTRLASSGSYFSSGDSIGEGAERLIIIPGAAVATREADKRARNSGQFGVQLRWRLGETDLGFYALRYHEKGFSQVSRLGVVNLFGKPTVLPVSFYNAYNEAASTFGVSATRTFGDANVAAEMSIRRNQSLASSGGAVDASALAPPGVVPPTDNRDHPGYAVGNTAHLNISTIWAMPRTALWAEAGLLGEIVWNRMLSCEKHCSALDTNGTRDAAAFRLVLSPTYRQAISGLDLTVPIGLGYTFKGSRSLALGSGALPPENGGDMTIGLSGEYLATWKFNLAFTHYYGKAETFVSSTNPPFLNYGNFLRDRDFVAFTVRRTF